MGGVLADLGGGCGRCQVPLDTLDSALTAMHGNTNPHTPLSQPNLSISHDVDGPCDESFGRD